MRKSLSSTRLVLDLDGATPPTTTTVQDDIRSISSSIIMVLVIIIHLFDSGSSGPGDSRSQSPDRRQS